MGQIEIPNPSSSPSTSLTQLGQNESPNPSPSNQKKVEELKGENEKEIEELNTTTREQEGVLQNLLSTAIQLANYYFVFQGVILTAILNGTSTLVCSDCWFPFTLSLIAATLNLTALFIFGRRYIRIVARRDENWHECNALERMSRTESPPDAKKQRRIQIGDPYKERKLNVYFAACLVFFLGFAGLTLSGCWHIICRKNECKNLPGDDKCIKLCEGRKCIMVCTLNTNA